MLITHRLWGAGTLKDSAAASSPTRRQGFSLRWRLVFLVVVAVVPLLAFSAVHQFLQFRADIQATGRNT